MERTFAMVKPDGVKRGLVGEVIKRIELKGYRLVGLKLMQLSEELAKNHYNELSNTDFFQELIAFITSGPVVAMVWEGKNVIKGVRSLMGVTDPLEASPGTIRGDLASAIGQNVVHGSDSIDSAQRELGLFFPEKSWLD